MEHTAGRFGGDANLQAPTGSNSLLAPGTSRVAVNRGIDREDQRRRACACLHGISTEPLPGAPRGADDTRSCDAREARFQGGFGFRFNLQASV